MPSAASAPETSALIDLTTHDESTDPLLPELGLGTSLMARAQRGSLGQRQLADEAARFAADLATSSLPQEQAHNALRQLRIDFQARERATRLATDLRSAFDSAQFTASVEAIRDQPDSVAQLRAIGALRSSFARYRTVPELARLMDDQLATLEPALAARQEARLHERISANRYAFTPEEAAQKFPGYRITPMPLPRGAATGSGNASRLIYIAEDDVDPRLEAEAFHLLHTASAWGDPAKLEALDRVPAVPAVAAVLRVPGSKFAAAYIAAVSGARSPAPAAAAPEAVAPISLAPDVSASTALAPAGKTADISDAAPVPAPSLSGGAPYGATLNTPLGPATVQYPKDYRLLPEHYLPQWARKWLIPDPHPERTTIADVIARGGRYVDPALDRDRPQWINPNAKAASDRTVEFREPVLKSVVDGLQYSVIGGAEKKRHAPTKGSSLDGVTPKNDILRGAPEERVRQGGQLHAAVNAVNSLMAGQVQAATNLARYQFVYNEGDGSWRVLDISDPRPGAKPFPLGEGQGREILQDIFERYGHPAAKSSLTGHAPASSPR